jgi:ubiquinol-cytochrome c reductase cytochrome c subunit
VRRFRSSISFSVILTATLFMLCLSAVSQRPVKNARNKSDAKSTTTSKGEQLYTSYGCYECHGRQGQGSITAGARLAPGPIAFEAFTAYVRQPSGQMPPYTSKVVSDADLQEIYSFLKSIPRPPSVNDTPLLK